ncbi:NADPH-dependent pterin aldehyde reductase-like isoform X6 [Benincasa hispida]|uniref:NADPH-dependent pterin aldehyde reductase-like isoform X6 n=2 Tax=Benincasa hispida TaxID=102211 RepID=UPI0019014DFC|nr:NADPH-dependent pterin aldehyde reductase-like isoform X6 [Benincasa hispida]
MEVSKKVLITGVSKGLGRALALELATHNHTIIGCSRSQLKLDSLQDELSRLYPNNHHLLFNVDVTSNSNIEKFAQLVENNLVPDIIGAN